MPAACRRLGIVRVVSSSGTSVVPNNLASASDAMEEARRCGSDSRVSTEYASMRQ